MKTRLSSKDIVDENDGQSALSALYLMNQ
jgi:hypothetical protein